MEKQQLDYVRKLLANAAGALALRLEKAEALEASDLAGIEAKALKASAMLRQVLRKRVEDDRAKERATRVSSRP